MGLFSSRLNIHLDIDAFQKELGKHIGPDVMDMDEVKKIYVTLIESLRNIELPTKSESFSEFVQSVRTIKTAVMGVVSMLEVMGRYVSSLDAEAKKKIATDLLEKLVVFPAIIELFDEFLFGLLVSFVVDEFNKRFGDEWAVDDMTKAVSGK